MSLKVDRYIGRQLQQQRQKKGISIQDVCHVIEISKDEVHDRETGKSSVPVSDVFSLKKNLDINLDPFFSYDGEYYPDVILEDTEMADVFHYFSNIEDSQVRHKILGMIKEASSVF